ncbi:MAG: hypothetical protein M5R42_04255, partial [Rhodocyclaceae bacterium]|nr:hypothetical protein [Rhodocyclaceae bacterium]
FRVNLVAGTQDSTPGHETHELAGIGMTSPAKRADDQAVCAPTVFAMEQVLAAMAAVPRHIFIGEEALASRAYEPWRCRLASSKRFPIRS